MIPQKHSFAYLRELKNICHPLFLNTTFSSFQYTKIYSNNKCVSLNTDQKIEKHMLFADNGRFFHDYKIFDIGFNSERFKDKSNHNHLYVFSEDIGNGYWTNELKKFNIKSCFNIVKKYPHYYERFGFLSELDRGSYSFCINDLDLLENFILYFKEHAANLIKINEQNGFIWINNDPSYCNMLQEVKERLKNENQRLVDFNVNLKLKRYTITNNNNQAHLNPNKIKYLQYISQGYSYKEIGRFLQISHRTIEAHMQDIKNNLAINSNDKLIKIYRSSMLGSLR